MDALPVGTRLAEFEILSLLGVGGFGMVYKAFDHSLHRTVAIKEYMPATLAARAGDGALWARSSTDEPAFQAGLHSFVDEARMLAQFDHPSLVKVFRFWESHNTAYMVMPLYRGMTFKQARTQMRAPPSEAWLRSVLWAVLDALRVLHEANALHRDISPDNIFLQDIGPPVLLDLGASRHAINDRNSKNTAVLKVNYAPIEQYSDGGDEDSIELPLEQGPWSDLYSLAAVVHGCLCNDAPLPATLRSLRDRMVPFTRVARTVRKQFGQEYSAPFILAISQSLKLQPEDRPQSIDAFLELMEMSAAPAGLDQFDFRAELGDLWVEPTDQPDISAASNTVDLSRKATAAAVVHPAAPAAVASTVSKPGDVPVQVPEPDSVSPSDVADTVFLDRDSAFRASEDSQGPAANDVAPKVSPYGAVLESEWTKDKAVQPGWRPPRLWLGATVAALLVVGAAAWALRGTPQGAHPTQPAADAIITELKAPEPAPVPPLATADANAEALAKGQSANDEPAAIAEPPPAFVATDDPRAVSRAPARSRKASRDASEQSVPAAYPVQPIAPEPVPPPPAPAPAVRKPPAPAPLCANTNVLTRSMCLREECRKPGNAARGVCVEFRKAIEPLENNNFSN